jgi:putative transposase
MSFTDGTLTDLLKSHNVGISVYGRGRDQDNIFIERLSWLLKYQYLNHWSLDIGADLYKGIEQ